MRDTTITPDGRSGRSGNRGIWSVGKIGEPRASVGRNRRHVPKGGPGGVQLRVIVTVGPQSRGFYLDGWSGCMRYARSIYCDQSGGLRVVGKPQKRNR